MSNLNNTAETLKGLFLKGQFQLVDAVIKHRKKELIIDTNAIIGVLRDIPEKQRIISNVAFLKNMIDNEGLFDKLVYTHERKAEEGTDEFMIRAITNAIKTFKQLEKLSEKVTGEDYASFIGWDYAGQAEYDALEAQEEEEEEEEEARKAEEANGEVEANDKK